MAKTPMKEAYLRKSIFLVKHIGRMRRTEEAGIRKFRSRYLEIWNIF